MPIAKIRKSGNSTVLVISPEEIEEKNLHIGETVEDLILKKGNIKNLWGMSKHLKIDAQKAKDELREEW